MKVITIISRYIGGAVFIFSGFVKAIDPSGSQIKFSDYLVSGGIHLPDNLLLIAAMLLCATEFIIGISLITGYLYRYGVIAYSLLMAFFTPLTLFIAIFNPVSDCGCFGDAIHMTNWQTFLKNIILLIPAVIMLLTLKQNRNRGVSIRHASITGTITVMFIIFMIYNINQLPLIDFRPYKIGTNIPEAMAIPPNAPQAKYKISLIYEKNGERKDFTLENYPANDTSWKFVEQKSVVIEKGYEPPITSFDLFSADGTEVTQDIINAPGYILLMVSHKLDKADEKELRKGFEFGKAAIRSNIPFYVVTSSTGDYFDSYANEMSFLVADEVLLKTIIRSNPGYLLLKEGTILAKWSSAGLPEETWITGSLTGKVINELTKYRQLIIMATFLIISLLAVMITGYILRKLPEKED